MKEAIIPSILQIRVRLPRVDKKQNKDLVQILYSQFSVLSRVLSSHRRLIRVITVITGKTNPNQFNELVLTESLEVHALFRPLAMQSVCFPHQKEVTSKKSTVCCFPSAPQASPEIIALDINPHPPHNLTQRNAVSLSAFVFSAVFASLFIRKTYGGKWGGREWVLKASECQ